MSCGQFEQTFDVCRNASFCLGRYPLGQGKYLNFSLCMIPHVGLYEKYGEESHFVGFA